MCSFLGFDYFMGMSALPACTSVYYVHAWCPWRAGKSTRSSVTRVSST